MQWPWKFAQGTSGPLWIAFRYVDTEPVIGCYDPNSEQLELIKVGDQAEGADVVQHGTRHVRLDDRGWLWMTRRGVLVYDGQAWHPFHTHLPDSHFSDTRLTYEDREGNIWVGLWGGGLVFCDPVVPSYTVSRRPTRLRGRVGRRREGRLWIGRWGAKPVAQTSGFARGSRRGLDSGVDRQGQVWSGGPAGTGIRRRVERSKD